MRKTNEKIERPFGTRDKVGYMFGDFGCNMSFQLLSSWLMLFVTQGLGLTMAHWSIIVIVSKIFDAINDPIIGAMVDARRPTKHGKYRPWIFFASFAIAFTTLLLFIDIRGISYWGRFAYCLIIYCLWSVAYTAANVPYGSLNASLTDDAGQRASLSSLRSIGAGLATIPIMVFVPMLVYGEKDSQGIQPLLPERFIWIALACGIVGIICFMITVGLTKERNIIDKPKEKTNYFKTLKGFFQNRAAMGMSVASFAQLVFIMSYSVLLPLVCQIYFKDASKSGIVGIIMMIPMVFVIPFMGKLSKKFGKKEISTWPNILSIVILIIMLIIPFPQNAVGMWTFAALLAISMLAAAPFMLATWSMVADCVDEQEVKTGKREEASVYATYSFARKVAQGIGSSFVALCTTWVGYNSADSSTWDASGNGLLKLSIALPLVGFILVFLSLLFIYNLNKKKVESNTAYLREKHKNELESLNEDEKVAIATEAVDNEIFVYDERAEEIEEIMANKEGEIEIKDEEEKTSDEPIKEDTQEGNDEKTK